MTWLLTNSEAQTYLRCRRRWYLGYHLELEPSRERLVPPRLRGNLTHSALQLYYEAGVDPLEYVRAEGVRLVQVYLDQTEEPDQEEIDQITKVVDLVAAMVEGYTQWVAEEGRDVGLTLLQAEAEVEAPLINDDVHLLGKLDAKFRRDFDGFTFFMDHKTVGDLVQLPKWAQLHPQMKHYALIERINGTARQHPTDGGVFNMLRTVKRTARSNPPYYERHEVRFNDEALRNHWKQLVGLAQELLRAQERLNEDEDHHVVCPPKPDQDCAWSCDFFMLCPMMDDGSDWEGLMSEAYRRSDPLQRYVSIEKG